MIMVRLLRGTETSWVEFSASRRLKQGDPRHPRDARRGPMIMVRCATETAYNPDHEVYFDLQSVNLRIRAFGELDRPCGAGDLEAGGYQ
jgi:hypothetical protein